VYAQSVAYLITAVIVFAIVWRKSNIFHLRFDLNYFLLIIKQSWPYALLILFMSLYSSSGLVLLERLAESGSEQAGIYAQGNRILEAVSMFGFLFASLLLPMFSRMIKQQEQIEQLLRLSAMMMLVPSVILAIASYYYRSDIMYLLRYEYHPDAAIIFSLLMFSFLGIGNTYIFGSLLTANGNLYRLNLMAGFAFVLNLTMNLILIPKFGALGLAVTTIVTQIVTGLVQIIMAKHAFRLQTNIPLMIKTAVFSLIVVAAGYLSTILPFLWIYNFLILILFSFLVAFSARLISVKLIYQVIKNTEEPSNQPTGQQ
jgi:O-antigen/teichoic acid export membrane protein